MGPCFISTEDGRGVAWSISRLSKLQWGRASSARKTRAAIGRQPDGLRASMGPCFISTEDLLQVKGLARGQGQLQWGRASSARKTCPTMRGHRCRTCFNGAVLHQHGRPPASQLLGWRVVWRSFSRGLENWVMSTGMFRCLLTQHLTRTLFSCCER